MPDDIDKKQDAPELEPRRGSVPAAPSDERRRSGNVRASAQSELPMLDEHARQRMAIYLIEREAIALRRQRWIDFRAGKERSASAFRSIEAEPEGAQSEQEPGVTDADRLQQYARPAVNVSDAERTRGGRARAWITSLFRM